MFTSPHYLHALWLIPVLALLQWRAFRREHRATDAFVAASLRGTLMAQISRSRTWAVFALYMLAFACFIIAIAQPRWGEERREIPETGKNVIIAIDTSRSMMADDMQPNRLTRAKLAAQDILATLSGYRVGLIAFAGRAYLQAPLTTDHEAVVESIEALDCFTVPKGGTKLGDVMRAAFDAFEKTGSRNHGLILLTDGGDDDPDVQQMLKRARDQQVRIVAIGCGTDVGSLIPNPDPDKTTEFVLDDTTGKPVHTRLEEATLQRLASETNGRYLRLGVQAINTVMVKQVLELLESVESGQRQRVKPIERFQWPLAVGIVSLMFALFLRPSVAPRTRPGSSVKVARAAPLLAASNAVVVLLFALLSTAQAAWTGPKQMTSDDALRAYSEHDYGRARDLYARLHGESKDPELAYGLGTSAMKLKEYERANQAFSNALEASDTDLRYRAHRGLGTNLWDQGKGLLQGRPEVTLKAWIDALRHFDSALQIRPDDQETQANRDYVAKFIEQVKQTIEQKKQQEQQQGEKGDKDDKKEKGEEGDKGEKGEKGDKSEDGEEGKDGKEGDPKDGKEGKDGKEQNGKDGDPSDKAKDGKDGDKDSEDPNSKEGDKDKEGKDKDGKDGKDGKEKSVPEGQIQTKDSKDGKPELGDSDEVIELMDKETGYTPNDARNQLRTYTDEQRVKVQRRREFGAKKDW